MDEVFYAEFYDRAGNLDHNMTGTLREILLAAQGRHFKLEEPK